MINNKKSTKKGFTLIEIVIVISVILVLGSLLLPKYNGYKNKADNLKIVDTGRQIYLAAVESYTGGNDDFDADEVKEAAKELIGIDDIEVTKEDEDGTEEISIKYTIDSKNYFLVFNDTDSGFLIKDSTNKQLHPK